MPNTYGMQGEVLGNSICYSGVKGGSGNTLAVKMTVFWQIPQYLLIGTSEVLASITGSLCLLARFGRLVHYAFIASAMEFFYSQAPNCMKSVCSALNLVTTAFGT